MAEIKNDPIASNWIEGSELEDRTAESYYTHIRRYCNFNEMTPTELIEEAREDQVKSPWMAKRRIKPRMVKYNKYLKNETSMTYASRKLAIGIVKIFYAEYEIELPKKIKVKESVEEKKERSKQKIPTIEDIREAVAESNYKYSAFILLLSTSGMSKNEARHLTLEDYYHALGFEDYESSILKELNDHVSKNTIPTFMDILRRKTGIEYTTFCTPETMRYINKYLSREYKNKEPLNGPETKLFVPFQQEKNKSGMISDQSIATYFRKLNERMGWGKSGRFIFFHPHSLRKFFATTLNNNRVPFTFTHWLLGHKIDITTETVTDPYIKNNDLEKLKREYHRVIPYLSIKETDVDVIEDNQTRKFKAQLKQQSEEIAELKRTIGIISDHEKTKKPD